MKSTLHDLDAYDFRKRLNSAVSPSAPIKSPSHLKGRQDQLDKVIDAIQATGRHVFIFGERGVGKTSLAITAAAQCASSRQSCKHIGCDTDSTFGQLMERVFEVFSPKHLKSYEETRKVSLGWILGGAKESVVQTQCINLESVTTVSDVLASLDEDDQYQDQRVVVLDEVDRLRSKDVKAKLAALIKLLGDRASRTTIIFTGVGSSLEEILGAHPSSFRQLTQIHLDRLQYGAAVEIVIDAFSNFGIDHRIEPARQIGFRIAHIANGFPYYVHLLLEKVIQAYYKDKAASMLTVDHLLKGTEAAISDVAQEIRKPYDMATRGRSELHRLAVWAAADSWDLERQVDDIYRSYIAISQEGGFAISERVKFTRVLGQLKKDGSGGILKSGYSGRRRGLYEFSENIIRGYVRLCAQAEGIELNDKRPGPPPEVTARSVRSTEKSTPTNLGMPPRSL